MITISPSEISKYGGFLNALNHASFEYIHKVLKGKGMKHIRNLKDLDRIILHLDPHLDEYFASLLFLSSLPKSFRNTEYVETALTKEFNNVPLEAITQNAAIFGIGSVGNLGKKALFNFDEHVQGKRRKADSCTELVKRQRLKKYIPNSLFLLIQEINSIDSSGGAHDQHLGNVIKRGHDVRLILDASSQENVSRSDWLSPFWKWSLMNASIVSVIYALEEKIDLHDFEKAKDYVTRSMEYFFEHSGFKHHEDYAENRHEIWKHYRNQKVAFEKAVYGNSKPQYFLLSRVCLSLHRCFGDTIAHGIMMHFWEILYHNQRHYLGIVKAFKPLLEQQGNHVVSNKFGYAEKREFKVHFEPFSRKPIINVSSLKTQIIYVEPLPSVTSVNQALNSLLKECNHGFGFMYIWNSASGSVALFKSSGIPNWVWRKIKYELKRREPNRWHDEGFDHFILNGNKAHQYVKRTNITLDELEGIITRIKNQSK